MFVHLSTQWVAKWSFNFLLETNSKAPPSTTESSALIKLRLCTFSISTRTQTENSWARRGSGTSEVEFCASRSVFASAAGQYIGAVVVPSRYLRWGCPLCRAATSSWSERERRRDLHRAQLVGDSGERRRAISGRPQRHRQRFAYSSFRIFQLGSAWEDILLFFIQFFTCTLSF